MFGLGRQVRSVPTVFVRAESGRLLPCIEALERKWRFAADREQSAVCFVPDTAPLFDAYTSLENLVMLAGLAGAQLTTDDAVHALRLVELPDMLHRVRCGELDRLRRLQIWLAVGRSVRPQALAFDNPFASLTVQAAGSLARLLVEPGGSTSVLVVSGPDSSLADLVGADLTADAEELLRS